MSRLYPIDEEYVGSLDEKLDEDVRADAAVLAVELHRDAEADALTDERRYHMEVIAEIASGNTAVVERLRGIIERINITLATMAKRTGPEDAERLYWQLSEVSKKLWLLRDEMERVNDRAGVRV